MKKLKFFKQVTVCVLVLLLAMPLTLMAQIVEEGTSPQTSGYVFRQEELDQMLAPIALYPDALLAQILTASTYPIEVVAAARFLKANGGLSAEALLEAAQDKDWDPSVKALLEFPRVLTMMDEQIEWTSKVGDAFLAQQSDVMNSIQRLRQKAYAEGNLATTKEQVVNVEPQTEVIIIESATPYVVYVPVYDPRVVYGTWWYPDYLPYYFYLPRYVGAGFFAGIFIDLAWGWGSWGCDWYHRDVRIREQPWQHDPQHRRGVGYRDYSTAQRFGGQQRIEPTTRPSAPEVRVQNQFRTNADNRIRNVTPQTNPGPTRTESRPETKFQIPTTQLNTTPRFNRQQTPGATNRQQSPGRTIRQQSPGQTIRQNAPNIQRSAPNIQQNQIRVNRSPTPITRSAERVQEFTRTSVPKQDIKTQINTPQLRVESRPNTQSGGTRVTGIQNRVERVVNSGQQPRIQFNQSNNGGLRSPGVFNRGGGR